MTEIIKSPYYFSVYSDIETDHNFYGLLDIKQNCFYMLHRNHSLLKFLQLMLLKNFYTFSIVSFKHFNCDINKNIDNRDCINWGGTADMINSLELEANTSMYEAKLIKVTPGYDLILQEKMFFIMYILTKLDNLFKKLRNHEIDIKETMHKGYDELKKYLGMLCPDDKNINEFIDEEDKQLRAKTQELDVYWQKILMFFYNLDFRNNSTISMFDSFKKYIETPKFELERFRRLYQHPHTALDEFYKILGIIRRS